MHFGHNWTNASYVTQHLEKARQLQILLLKFGYKSKLEDINSMYRLTICGQIHDIRFTDTVVSVTKLPYQDELYDFVLPETESFIGNGFVNHNCLISDEFACTRRSLLQTDKGLLRIEDTVRMMWAVEVPRVAVSWVVPAARPATVKLAAWELAGMVTLTGAATMAGSALEMRTDVSVVAVLEMVTVTVEVVATLKAGGFRPVAGAFDVVLGEVGALAEERVAAVVVEGDLGFVPGAVVGDGAEDAVDREGLHGAEVGHVEGFDVIDKLGADREATGVEREAVVGEGAGVHAAVALAEDAPDVHEEDVGLGRGLVDGEVESEL